MKPRSRILPRVLALAWLLGAFPALHLDAASTWRDFPVDRRSEKFVVGVQDFRTTDCIGWACRGVLLGEPVHRGADRIAPPASIYEHAARFKSRPGERMNARHGAEALLDLGLIQAYEELAHPYAIWDWLKYEGPVAAAIYWDEAMTGHRNRLLREIPVDREIWRTNHAHAITILGWHAEKRAFLFTPNLGTGWGSGGFALLRETDMPFVFVNAVGLVHEGKLGAAAIGAEPPGTRASRRAAAEANVWYTAGRKTETPAAAAPPAAASPGASVTAARKNASPAPVPDPSGKKLRLDRGLFGRSR